MTEPILRDIVSFVDDTHAKCKAVVARDIVAHVFDNHQMNIDRRTAGRELSKLGLTWAPIRTAKRTYASYRKQAVKDYLIGLDGYIRDMNKGKSNNIFIFTDESYININHGYKSSYLPQDNKEESKIEKKSGKGRRLVILHATSRHGPLVGIDDNTGFPIDDLHWKGDTPHSTKREDGKTTSELMWMASSHTGDYPDNMNSDMFMLWVEEKLIPTFETQFPGKKMVLVADNAPYHHKRVIGSLATLSKKNLVAMMTEHEVEYLDLPLTDQRIALAATEEDDDDIHDRGDCVRIPFKADEQSQTAGISKPMIGSLKEIKLLL